MLKTSIWLPLRYVEKGVIRERKFSYVAQEHLEGFVNVRPEDAREIFSKGSADLRMFHAVSEENQILRLAYEPPQPAVAVRIGDLVVLQEHREQFEQAYEITALAEGDALRRKAPVTFDPSEDYRHIRFEGHEYHLGDVQAKILRLLHDASRSRNPWVHGKTLICESGSNAVRIRDLFKNKPHWRKLILTNDRGYYRLNLPAEQLQQPPADCTVNTGDNGKRHIQAV